jgi:uncharacterized protein
MPDEAADISAITRGASPPRATPDRETVPHSPFPVIDLPNLSVFTSLLADPRVWVAIGIAALSGLVRGFSGFGSALIYVPLMAALFGPRVAAGTLVLIDFVAGTPFAIGARRDCDWRDLVPISIAAAIGVPFGTYVLLFADPITLRWIIAALVLGLLAVLVSGWRYHISPTLPVKSGVGFLAGLGAGAVQVGGPFVIIYWLSSKSPPVTIRANLLVYFVLNGAALLVAYTIQGVLTADVVAFALVLGPPFWLAMAIGARFFRGSSDHLYRNVAYAIVALAALISLPLFDGFFR